MLDHRIIDQTVVNELKELSDVEAPTFFWDQVQLFKHRGEELASAIRAGVLADDPERVTSASHALAGSAAVIGARRLQALCSDLEVHCEHWRRMHAEMMSDLIDVEVKEVERLLFEEASAVCIYVERVS